MKKINYCYSTSPGYFQTLLFEVVNYSADWEMPKSDYSNYRLDSPLEFVIRIFIQLPTCTANFN